MLAELASSGSEPEETTYHREFRRYYLTSGAPAARGTVCRVWQHSRVTADKYLKSLIFLLPGSAGGSTLAGWAKERRAGGTMMSGRKPQLRDYRLTTAEILYHLPDHPVLLQSFVWQHLDCAPDYPNLRRFLEFWQKNIEGRLHSVRVGQARLGSATRFRHVALSRRLQ